MIPISGQWNGTYTLGPEYGEKLEGKTEQFTLTLTEMEPGVFEGIAIDLADNELAHVHGYVEGTFISFVKRYDNPQVIEEDGTTRPLEANVEQWHLHYSGNYDEVFAKFTGEWELTGPGDHNAQRDSVDIFTGAWEMEKA